MSAIAGEDADRIKSETKSGDISEDGFVFLTSQIDLVHELSGMFMGLGEGGPRLIQRA